MTGPPWLAGVLAAVMILTAGYAASRLAASRMLRAATEADSDGLHVLMGTAMAGMFLPQFRLLPSAAWAVIFGAAAAWFAGSTIHARKTAPPTWQCRFPVPHLVECMAMLYMLLAVPAARRASGMAMPGMGSSPGASAAFPALALVLALFMLGYLLWTTDRIATRARAKTVPTAMPRPKLPALVSVPAAPGDLASLARPIDTPGAAEAPLPPPAAGHPLLAAQFGDFSKIMMSIAMGYMLITML